MSPKVGNQASSAHQRQWHLWVDTGGTFTDCLAVSPTGDSAKAKVLSSGNLRTVVVDSPELDRLIIGLDESLPPDFFKGARLKVLDSDVIDIAIGRYRSMDRELELEEELPFCLETGTRIEIVPDLEAPIFAAHWVTKTPIGKPLPSMTMRLATTRGTNALLERSGSPTALFITRGFADLLAIGNQQRPDLFLLGVEKRQPLYAAVVEVDERLDSDGRVMRPLSVESVRPAAIELLDKGINVAAVAFMHSYHNPTHEKSLATFLTELGFGHVSCSAELAPMIRILPRAETAVVNAYLSGVIGSYLESVDRQVVQGPLHVLTSAGSLVRATGFAPKDSLLSGPAGGVVGAANTASRSGQPRSLAFDMGGTSTDVSRFDGNFDYRFETHVGDAQLLSPSLAIETVAAGGGSICQFDGRQLKVGPQSAGADPGPACYGAGGPLTLTDVNLLLGRLRPESFEIPIDGQASERAAQQLLTTVERARPGARLDRDRMLQGLVEIANERMAEAVRRISIRQGYRASDYALVAFGGAGGQHACALAELLGIETILIPEDAGLLSAVGLGYARVERLAERLILEPLGKVESTMSELVKSVAEEARIAVINEGIPKDEIENRRVMVYLRLAGQESSLGVDYNGRESLRDAFARMYEDAFGYSPADLSIEVEAVRVIAASCQGPEDRPLEDVIPDRLQASEMRRVFMADRWQTAPLFFRSQFSAGSLAIGPALVFESHCASVVDRGWKIEMDGARCLVLTRISPASTRELRLGTGAAE